MNQLSDPIQLKAPSCQSNSTHGILNCLKTNFILSLHTSNPSLHSLQPQVLSTTTSESGSDPELEPLATSERSSRKASMSVSCSESQISEMSTSLYPIAKKNHQKPSKNPQREATFKSPKVSLCPSLWTPSAVQSHWPFQPAPRRCGRALLHAAANDAGAGSHAHRPVGCEAVVWSLGLWTGKRSVILNSVCHV